MATIIQKRILKSLVYQRNINGKEKTFSESFFSEKYLMIRKEEIENGKYDIPLYVDADMYVLDYFDRYFKSVCFKEYSQNTYYENISLVKNYLLNYFQGVKMKDIDQKFVQDLDNAINHQTAVGRNFNNKINAHIENGTKNRIKSLLKKIFNEATNFKIYKTNPMLNLCMNYSTTRYQVDWDIKAVELLFDKSKGTRFNIFLHCLFGTDLLIKEILALQWSDLKIGDENLVNDNCYAIVNKFICRKTINELSRMENDVIKIFPPVLNYSGNTRLTIYKSNAEKKVTIPTKVAWILKLWKDNQEKIKSSCYEDNDLVIALENGKAVEDRVITKDFEYIKKTYKLMDVKLAKLKRFSNEKICENNIVYSIRDYYYNSLTLDDIKTNLRDIKLKTNNGNYLRARVDLKNIDIPKQNKIDLMKVVSILKNNPEFASELASILNE